MHYAVSDIHGCFDLYLELLKKISFSDADTLFFLGDAADRGPDGIDVMKDLMKRPNVVCLLGNHEDMFRRVARAWGKKLTWNEGIEWNHTFVNWTERNGGDLTWAAYLALPEEERKELLAWMEGLPTWYEIAVNGRAFLLAHAGVGAYRREKKPENCELFDFIWERMDYSRIYYRNKLLVTGHTPTGLIDPAYVGRILQRNNHVCIDCGAVFRGSLGCICLETLEEIYVSNRE